MSCVYCATGGYWICDSDGRPSSSLCGPDLAEWTEVGDFEFEAGSNTVWCKPGSNCGAQVGNDPGGAWKEAGTIPLAAAATATVFCMGTGPGGPCQVKVEF